MTMTRQNPAGRTFTCYGEFSARILTLFAVVFSLATAGMAIALKLESTDKWAPMPYMVAAFAGASFLLILGAWGSWRRLRLYGESTLEVERYPDETGNLFLARVICAAAVGRQREVSLKLTFKRRERHGSGDFSMRDVQILKATLETQGLAVRGDQCVIPVKFDVPEEPPPDPEAVLGGRSYWELVVQARGPLPQYFAAFILSDGPRPPGAG